MITICIIILGKFLLKFIYFIFKLFPSQNKIVFLSRQSDTMSIDYSKIIERLIELSPDIKIVTLLKRQEKDTENFIASGFENAIYLLKQMWALARARVAVVDGYCIPVSILKHNRTLTIIQIWHAIGAFKKFGLQTLPLMTEKENRVAKALKMHDGYSYVIAPS